MTFKSILLVSNYYPPEQGAAPNRIEVLAQSLQASGYKVQVVCPFPNYPTGRVFSKFRGKLYAKTIENGITVYRLWVWPSKSTNKFVRLWSMLSFSKSLALFFILKPIPKQVFIQYSPVFVGFTAVFWSWLFRKKTILNVSDLWPLAGFEMGLLNKGFYYSLLEKMESFCYRKADLILGQSEEILEHIKSKNPKTLLFLYRNFPNFQTARITLKTPQLPIKIVYAGLLGVAQGLSYIFSKITIPEQVEFHIYGEGPDAEVISQPKNHSIIYHGSVTRSQLHHELTQYDIAFIPLVNRIYGSVPSKIFEYARLGLPLLYMAGGEGGDLVEKQKLGWVVPVQDFKILQQFLNTITLAEVQKFPKENVQQNAMDVFDFNLQFEGFKKQLENL
ncbi:glycosyltransferase family 4 protein [Rasiella sp. SM2506]|uniref:glycosyltransferase family 4 protein n=1 Tax=Rasiella sp. SM2506 TaxID=3423914 RepID=UPI003D7A349E